MNKSTIEILYYGKKRRVCQQQYSKLRTYNKIKTDRHYNSKVSNGLANSQSIQCAEINAQQISESIQSLKKQIQILREQNYTLGKQLKKVQKIDKIISKRSQISFCNEQNLQNRTRQKTKKEDSNNKKLQNTMQIKLALDVIELQSILQQKCEQYSKLLNYKRKKNQQNIKLKLKQQKIKFLNILSQNQNQKQIMNIVSKFQTQDIKLKQKMNTLSKKSHIIKKQKNNRQKQIGQLNYQIKQLNQSTENRKRRLKKDSGQYCQIQNGQVKNQQDIKNQIQTIKDKRKQQGEFLQSFIQQKMLEKIVLITEMQNFGTYSQILDNKFK